MDFILFFFHADLVGIGSGWHRKAFMKLVPALGFKIFALFLDFNGARKSYHVVFDGDIKRVVLIGNFA